MIRKVVLLLAIILALSFAQINAQGFYHSSGGEIIFSGADVVFQASEVNTNIRFTLFFHAQHYANLDLTNNIGLMAGAAIRNVGLITEDVYQNVGFPDIGIDHPDYNKNTKMKRRSYSLGFPVALKLGSFSKHFFLFGGGEYEWMFHYKQKLFLDDQKFKFSEWTSNRVNSWIPSVFAGIQFPQGFRLKFKYYLDDFLNTGYTGRDFGEEVDYSRFESTRIWYVSLAFFLDRNQIEKWMGNDRSASIY